MMENDALEILRLIMKIKNSNGIIKDHVPLKERLLPLGFDEQMLIKDKNLIMVSINPLQGFFRSLINIKNNREYLNAPGFMHFGKKHRKINPVFVSTDDIMHSGDWIAFTPAVLDEKETSIFGNMDWMSRTARIFTKLVRVFTGRNDLPQFTAYILSNNSQNFNTSQSYFYRGTRFVKELSDDVLILAENESLSLPDEGVFMLSSSALCNINYVYIANNKTIDLK